MTLTMMELKGRFAHRPLMPPAVYAQQSRWRQRWGQKPAQPHDNSTSWDYHIDPIAIAGDAEPEDPRLKLRFALLSDGPTEKYFLTGTKGSGKSTLAYGLWADPEIQARYTVLGFSIADYLNLEAMDATQVLAVMIAQLVETLKDAQRDADLGVLDAKRTLKGLKRALEAAQAPAEFTQLNINGFGWFTAIFKTSQTARDAYRAYIDGHFDELMALFDELLILVKRYKSDKPVLFIIDDLDKIQATPVQQEVFNLQLPMLLRPDCAALYTFPLELHHDVRFSRLKNEQANYYVLANVKLVETRGGALLDEGRQIMTRFMTARLGGQPISACFELTEPQIDRLLHYACGNFRELCRILQHALQAAAMLKKPKADPACFASALRQLRKDYNPFVQRNREILNAVRRNLARAGDEDDLDGESLGPLLQALAVVDYPNDPGWLDVHPVVEDLLSGQKSTLGDA